MSSIINAGTSGVTITGSTSTVLSLATNGTTRLNIDASGNLAVGTGNLTFSSTGQRITGDFSGTNAARLYFQSSTTNGATSLSAMPNGTGTQTGWFLYAESDLTNNSFAAIRALSGTDMRLQSGISGTGTYLPMTFYTGGSERMRLDTSGNLGIGGTAAAANKVEIAGTLPSSSNNSFGFIAGAVIPSTTTSSAQIFRSGVTTQAASFTLSDLSHFRAGVPGGSFGAGSTVTTQYGFHAQDNLTGATNNYGFFSNIASGSNRWNFFANGTADNYFAGNVGIGTGVPSCKLHLVGSVDTTFAPNVFNQRLTGTSSATSGNAGSGISFAGYTTGTSTVNDLAFISGIKENTTDTNYAGALVFGTRTNGSGGGSFERMRIDSSGNVGIGGTADAFAKFKIAGTLPTSSTISVANYNGATIPSGTTSTAYGYYSALGTQAASFTLSGLIHYYINPGTFGAGSAVSSQYGYYCDSTLTGATNNYGFFSNIASGSNRWNFYAAGTAQNYFAGDTTFGTTNTNPAGNNVAGAIIGPSGMFNNTRDGDTPILTNRKTNDGTLVSLRQDGNEEGTISVSGSTVSYNAFAGSHWSQLQDGSKPDILRGTVMESINELCVWPGEQNERLPKSKVSDTAGSKKVYGVFMAWDNDWTGTNDMYVTAVGAFICRVNSAVTVQEGDLLESNGDGTARVQADDIIRSSTIGKVTSTVKTHQYADGSYCVPTVLYCG